MVPLVSVILPVRDGAGTILDALNSLFRQTFRDFEIVAIDHSSTDSTPALLAQASKQYAHMRIIGSDAPGLAGALNDGIALARGSLIARMDADDVCDPRRLKAQVDWLSRHRDVGVVATQVHFGGCAPGYARHVEWTNRLLTHEDISLGRFRESPLAHPSVMFSRECLERHGGYREGPFPEDYELWLRWLEAGVRFEKIPEKLLTWNDPANRLSRQDSHYSVENFYRIKSRYLARWLAANNPRHPHITVIGAGRITRRRVDFLKEHNVVVDAWADIDPRKIGKTYDGAPVIHHDGIPAGCFVVPYVGKHDAADYIRAMLEARGLVRGRNFIEAA